MLQVKNDTTMKIKYKRKLLGGLGLFFNSIQYAIDMHFFSLTHISSFSVLGGEAVQELWVDCCLAL